MLVAYYHHVARACVHLLYLHGATVVVLLSARFAFRVRSEAGPIAGPIAGPTAGQQGFDALSWSIASVRLKEAQKVMVNKPVDFNTMACRLVCWQFIRPGYRFSHVPWMLRCSFLNFKYAAAAFTSHSPHIHRILPQPWVADLSNG